MRCVNFPKKAIHVRGPTWQQQFIWNLAGGFYLGFEDFTSTRRCLQVYSTTWMFISMIATVCKELAPSTAEEGGAPLQPGVATSLPVSASWLIFLNRIFIRLEFREGCLENVWEEVHKPLSCTLLKKTFHGSQTNWLKQTAKEFRNISSLLFMKNPWKFTMKFCFSQVETRELGAGEIVG